MIEKREKELVKIAFDELSKIETVFILADNVRERLGVISFYMVGIHYNLVVKILNDRFGIQVRGGCACAGTYGHYLLDVSYEHSKEITEKINSGDLSEKPGWVRLSLHPTMTNEELYSFIEALKQIEKNIESWSKEYIYNKHTNEFRHVVEPADKTEVVMDWFSLE
jgi:selenocysteine lyase/cysteine desulfurase